MSRKELVEWSCDLCGVKFQQSHAIFPTHWLRIGFSATGPTSERHACDKCIPKVAEFFKVKKEEPKP